MPYLALDTTYSPTDEERRAGTATLTDRFVDEMATSSGHVAVTIRDHPPGGMALGRAVENEPIAVLSADVRRGRSFDRRRSFAVAVIDWLESAWSVPRPNCKVVFTDHPGDRLMGADRVGGEWSPEEESGPGTG